MLRSVYAPTADGWKPPVSIRGPIDNEELVQGARRGIAGQLRIGERSAKGRGVRVGIVMDKEKAPLSVSLRFETVGVRRVPVGRMVESAPPVREDDGVMIVPVMGITEIRLTPKEELHVRRAAKMRERQQTTLHRRHRATAEQRPTTGKPLTEAKAATNIEDNQR